MKYRSFLLIPISVFAFGLVALSLVAAGAASVDKPTGVDHLTPVTNSVYPIPINHSAPGFSPPASAMVADNQRSGTEIVAHGMSPMDQMRQEVMNASRNAEYQLDRVEFWLNQSSMSNMWGHADPGATITITTPREVFNAFADPNGNWGTDYRELYPGDQISVFASPGYSVFFTIPDPLEAHTDSSLSEVWGEIGGWYNQDVEVHRYWAGDPLVVQTDGSGAFVTTDETMPRGARGYIRFVDQVDTTQVIYHHPYYDIVPTVRVNYAHEWVENDYEPGYTVWLTLTNSTGEIKDTASGETGLIPWWGGSTGFATGYNLPWSSGQTPDFQAGDWVYVSFENGYTNQVQIGTIEGVLDIDEDTASGNIYAPWFTQTLSGGCFVWVENGPGMGFEVDPNGGSYLCDFGDLGWDLIPGQDVGVNYNEPDNDTVYNVFQAPWMRVNYAHNWVGGNYPLGHTFWLTVTDSLGEIKATAQVETESGRGWGGDGFETQGDEWLPQQPDIVPGDWVYFLSDDGFDRAIQVGDIQGDLDVDNDSVSGPIYAEWFDEELNVDCHPWGGPPDTPGKNSTAAPDGSDPYYCQWDAVTEWDIQPGQDVAVMYIEPGDFDRVINVFRDPAPDMHIEKWTEGSSEVMPGGPVVFNLYYSNDGDADAPGFTITDTLPANTTYLTDTSGVSTQFGPGWVSWDFGPAQPGIQGRFQVVLLNSAEPGDTLTNTAEIFTPYDSNEGNDYSQAQVGVVDENPDLYVNKNSVPGDPAPGQTFLYEISYGNNGPVASGAVVLTDTLPADTSIVSWYSENGYNLWNDVSISDDQLLLTAPTIPGYWGNRIILRLQVDPEVAVGTQLTNTVEITTANDTNPEDNWFMNEWTWTGEPRWDAGIAKWNNWGTLVPGGQVEYGFWLRNNGNMPAQTWVTDTLPEGTSFLQAQYWDGQNSVPFPPDYVDEDVVAWNMGEMQPGEWFDFAMLLDIDPALPPDTELTNCATIGIDGEDGYPYDNTACVVDAVRDAGPNLRVQKYFWWEDHDRLSYELLIQNIGTQNLDNVWFTDTYPISTTFNGDWWVNYGPYLQMTHDEANHQLIFWIESLDRGWNADISFRVDLDPEVVNVQGLAFTNTLDAPYPEDVFPDDNYKEVVAYTGPDVYVNKSLSGGELQPGEIVTFSVQVGNQNVWPWDGDPAYGSHITDTLPEGMTFITATAPWNPEEAWAPESIAGNEIAWGFWTMWSNSTWYFDIVAQISDDLVGGEVLTNRIEAYGDSPNDIEPNWENNVYELDMTIEAAPQASFTTNSPVRFGEAMIFTNSSIPGYPSPTYAWDFGDGSTSSIENPTHLYAAAGTYTVTLTVTNEIGSSSFSQEVEVEQPLIHLPLIFKNN